MDVKSPSSPSLSSGRDVLVVEDELRIRNMLTTALKQMDFNATLVGSAEAARRVLATQSFDILILDLNLPGASGLDLLRELRARNSEAQAIIMTGFGDLESAKAAIHLDVVEFLTKPCSLGTLEAALVRARQRRKGQIVQEAAADPSRRIEPEPEKKKPAPVVQITQPQSESALSLEEIEQRHIIDALNRNNGNRAATARELGISLRKLYYRLGEYQKKGLVSDVE
jgi:DNA-binding NtrC family response regulator